MRRIIELGKLWDSQKLSGRLVSPDFIVSSFLLMIDRAQNCLQAGSVCILLTRCSCRRYPKRRKLLSTRRNFGTKLIRRSVLELSLFELFIWLTIRVFLYLN